MGRDAGADARIEVFELLARDAFRERGFHKAAVTSLLRRAGLSALPARYASKAALYESLMGEAAPPVGKARVRQAAASVFATEGYFRATARRIGEAAGMNVFGVVRLYPNKADLWREVTHQSPPPGALGHGWAGSRLAFADDTRARVLTTARDLFQSMTFEAVSIRGVARAAKVSTGAVMGHFGSKADLWREAMGGAPPGDSVLTRRAPEVLAALKALLEEEPAGLQRRDRGPWRAARQLVAEIEGVD